MQQKPKNNFQTILVITIGFLIIYMINENNIFLYISLVVGIIGIVSEFLTSKIVWVWDKITWLLSKIMPNVLLTIVFYLFLFPVAILSRIFGNYDVLSLKNNKPTLFKGTNKAFTKANLEKH